MTIMVGYVEIFAVCFTILVASKIWRLVMIYMWRPYVLTRRFQKQGIKGPPYSLFTGSLNEIKIMKLHANQSVLDTKSNDIVPRVYPQYHKWCPLYGETLFYWHGERPVISISDPGLAKEILSNNFYLKPDCSPAVLALTGNGVAVVSGLEWVRRRKMVNPAFNVERIKDMARKMSTCIVSMLDEWGKQVNANADQCKTIEINGEFRKLTADIIAHTAFGSSYAQGKEAFEAQNELQHYCAASLLDVFIPGSHYLPTPSNLQLWRLDKRIRNSLKDIIKSRMNSPNSDCGHGNDLLDLMIGASESTENEDDSPKLNMDEIVEECKTFFFAGHETSSNLLTWTVFLLSLHQDWQTRLREEVLKECRTEIPDPAMLSRLKLANMVLLEALRLYCPIVEVFRQASKDMKLGNVMIPKDALVAIPLVKIHRNREQWGKDANEFNPNRFANGISKAARHPNALLAFGVGPRTCIGQNFAMLEAKAVLAMVLQRFSVSLSPEYKHAPIDNITLQPQYGLPIIIKPLPK